MASSTRVGRITAGDEIVTAMRGWSVGLAICYDIRFPQLFYALATGAHLIVLPAAFTVPTGISHWEPMLRARAVETGCYVASASVGLCRGVELRSQHGSRSLGHGDRAVPERADTSPPSWIWTTYTPSERLPVQHRRRDLFG
jgi:predicted amidohydrolase